jgi:NaMN:DMB phosphoribosyltransferase
VLPAGAALGAALGLSMVVDPEENMLGAAAALPVLPPAVQDIAVVTTQFVALRFGG